MAVNKRVTKSQVDDVTRVRGSAKELKERHRAGTEHRAKSGSLLMPNEVAGEYDAARLLYTTLGGEARALTLDDLAQFRANIKKLGRKYKKGITAQQVINLSRQEDRDKANKEIHLAVPAATNKGVIRFITNASRESDVKRHHVTVDLLGFDAATATPDKASKVAATLVKTSPLRIDCDCGRWRFWYRYIATVGHYNINLSEPAYPKIRNPNLTGVACKHILRVMHVLTSDMSVRRYVERMIEKGQADVEGRQHQAVKTEEARELAKKQAARRKEIAVKAVPKSTAKLKAKVAAVKPTAQKPSTQRPVTAKGVDKARSAAERNLRKLHEMGQISKQDFEAILKTLSKGA